MLYTHRCRANLNQLFISRRKNFHQPINITELAAVYDSSQPIDIGQARWSRGKGVCTSKQEVMGSNLARVACEVFSQTLGKHRVCSAIHTSVSGKKSTIIYPVAVTVLAVFRDLQVDVDMFVLVCIISSHQCNKVVWYDLVADMDFAQCNKVVSFYGVPGWTRNTYGRRYDVVALSCFNVRKFMHYCTYDLVASFRYDLVVLTGRYYYLSRCSHCLSGVSWSSSGCWYVYSCVWWERTEWCRGHCPFEVTILSKDYAIPYTRCVNTSLAFCWLSLHGNDYVIIFISSFCFYLI